MVERNAADYTLYLNSVFRDDPEFRSEIGTWQAEETQHGEALGRWAMLADPDFDFKAAFKRFTDGYQIATDATASIRGSRTGELVARCIVETGTSSFYSALRDASDEPVLREICHRIAGDEFRHYKLFYKTFKRYQQQEQLPVWRRLALVIGRVRESDDDELAYAYYAANAPAGAPYDRLSNNQAYARRAFACYQPGHVQRGTQMALKVAGLSPQSLFGRALTTIAWRLISRRAAA